MLDRGIAGHAPEVKVVEAFQDGTRLLAAVEAMRLEGVVSKLRDSPYRSGTLSGWRKVKTISWREDHRERFGLFHSPVSVS